MSFCGPVVSTEPTFFIIGRYGLLCSTATESVVLITLPFKWQINWHQGICFSSRSMCSCIVCFPLVLWYSILWLRKGADQMKNMDEKCRMFHLISKLMSHFFQCIVFLNTIFSYYLHQRKNAFHFSSLFYILSICHSMHFYLFHWHYLKNNTAYQNSE